MLQHKWDDSKWDWWGRFIESQVQHHILLPPIVSFFVSFYLLLIAFSRCSCPCIVTSSQIGHINSTDAVPIIVHRHSLHTLIFSFSAPSPLWVCFSAAAVSHPLPCKTIVAVVWGEESSRFTHSWRCPQQPRSCLFVTHAYTYSIFPFKTALPEKILIICSTVGCSSNTLSSLVKPDGL